MRCRK